MFAEPNMREDYDKLVSPNYTGEEVIDVKYISWERYKMEILNAYNRGYIAGEFTGEKKGWNEAHSSFGQILNNAA